MFKELLEQIKIFIEGLNFQELICLIIIVIAFLLIFFKKFFRKLYDKLLGKVECYIRPIADEAVKRSAEYFNSETGQQKMARAVQYVQEMTANSPWYIRVFTKNFNKVWLINRIEEAYQVYKSCMNSNIPDEKLDIKGNEVKKK